MKFYPALKLNYRSTLSRESLLTVVLCIIFQRLVNVFFFAFLVSTGNFLVYSVLQEIKIPKYFLSNEHNFYESCARDCCV